MFESKILAEQSGGIALMSYGFNGKEGNGVAVPDAKRQTFWTEANREVIPTLKATWAAIQSGSTSGISFMRNRALTISNREEGWDMITETGKQVAFQWALHFATGGASNLKHTFQNVKPVNISFGKSVQILENGAKVPILQQFSSKTGGVSYFNFDQIPGYAVKKFFNFEHAFQYATSQVTKTNGKIYFNLNTVDLNLVKQIPKGTRLYEQPLEQLGNKTLFEAGKITEWELSKILHNPELLKRTHFYKMGIEIPHKFITR